MIGLLAGVLGQYDDPYEACESLQPGDIAPGCYGHGGISLGSLLVWGAIILAVVLIYTARKEKRDGTRIQDYIERDRRAAARAEREAQEREAAREEANQATREGTGISALGVEDRDPVVVEYEAELERKRVRRAERAAEEARRAEERASRGPEEQARIDKAVERYRMLRAPLAERNAWFAQADEEDRWWFQANDGFHDELYADDEVSDD